MGKFKVGDLVVIKEGTHDMTMPESRMGLIIAEICKATGAPKNPSKKFTAIYKLWMTNGTTLNFHEMFLEKAEENNEAK
jgi:hypothetical protein